MITGAIFDMDGLLFDTEQVYNDEWYKIAKTYDLKVDEKMLDELRGTNGALMNKIVNSYWPTIDAAKLTNELFNNARVSLSKHVPIKKGVYELLFYFKVHEVDMAIASSAPLDLIVNNVRLAGIEEFFNVIVSGQQVLHGKPAPDIFLLAAEKLNKNPEECYVFEDGLHGVDAGVSAGCSTIMIPDLLPPTKECYKKCTGIYDSLLDVLAALKTNCLD